MVRRLAFSAIGQTKPLACKEPAVRLARNSASSRALSSPARHWRRSLSVIGPPHSDAGFVKAYAAETTEAFLDGHVSAFAFFGGVPRSILYDNSKLAVARILGDGKRQRTRAFSELTSHYLFADRFGRPGKGNDKGKVENLVGYARRNYLVPLPRAATFEELNAQLEARCRRRFDDRLRGHDATIGSRLAADQEAFLDLPAVPYQPCETRPVGSARCRWCVIATTITRCRPPTATAR